MKYIWVLIRNRLFSSVKSWSSSSKRKLILKWCDQKVRIQGNSAEACLRNKKMWYELQVLFVLFKISTQYINSNHNVKFRTLTSIAVFFSFCKVGMLAQWYLRKISFYLYDFALFIKKDKQIKKNCIVCQNSRHCPFNTSHSSKMI